MMWDRGIEGAVVNIRGRRTRFARVVTRWGGGETTAPVGRASLWSRGGFSPCLSDLCLTPPAVIGPLGREAKDFGTGRFRPRSPGFSGK
jgi:hypothetical protein